MQTGGRYGMIPLDASLISMYQNGSISYGDVLTTAQDPESVMKKLKALATKPNA
jgi:Tfp pilus assembly pilus retraction ATPase PilT